MRARAEADVKPPAVDDVVAQRPVKPTDVCPHCGVKNEDVPFGCDKMGHKAGGMGALFDWWPVKAWGPCPKATAAGLSYTRKGQGTDEMLFGSNDPDQ